MVRNYQLIVIGESNICCVMSVGTNSVRLRLQDKISAKQASISSESSNAAIETLTTSNSCHYSGCLNLSSIDNDNAKLMDCASCRSARYCSRDCQVNDWVNHKTLCKEIKKKLMEMAKIEEMLGMDRVDMNKDNQPSESDEIEDNLN